MGEGWVRAEGRRRGEARDLGGGALWTAGAPGWPPSTLDWSRSK